MDYHQKANGSWSDGRDNSGLHPTSRTNSHKLVEKIFQSILAVGELPTPWQETKGSFHSQGRESHSRHSKGFKADKQNGHSPTRDLNPD